MCADTQLDDEDEEVVNFLLNYSLDEPSVQECNRRGSRKGKKANLDRDFAGGHARIFNDYFAEHPTFDSLVQLFCNSAILHHE